MRLLWLAPMITIALSADIVDRVAVSLGNRVITTSEIEERIRLTAFQNEQQPDFRTAPWKAAMEQLIDQKLVEREMQLGRYNVLSEATSTGLVTQFSKKRFGGDAAFLLALTKYRITAKQLRQDLARQADLLTFLDLRFRPAVQVTDEDVRKFYRENVEPKNTPERPMTLNDARAAIEETLTNARADKELDLWLKDQRKRMKLEYRPEAIP